MPKATLLGKDGSSYGLRFGTAFYAFNAGEPQDVPPAVAVAVSKIRNRDGSPKFKVEDMPEVVEPARKDYVVAGRPVKQNDSPRQLQFAS